MADQRLVAPAPAPEDSLFEASIRPRRLADYIGQAKVKDNLAVFIGAARDRGEALDHVLLYGPPGLGKTTLAHILANEMGVGVLATSGPALEKSGDLAAILTNVEEKGVLFVDEVHRMNRTVEEVLYPAMEDFHIDIIIGKGPGARSVKLGLPKFTLVGATTRLGLLSSPFRDRFGVVFRLDFYTREELTTIVNRTAGILGTAVHPEAAGEIARRSRGTPRIANRLLRRARDFAQVEGEGVITLGVARRTLSRLEIDDRGLDEMDRKVLLTLMDRFAGGPAGIETLSASIGEERDTIEDTYEPFLLQEGFLQRTPRGRVATELAYEHFGRKAPANRVQPELFEK